MYSLTIMVEPESTRSNFGMKLLRAGKVGAHAFCAAGRADPFIVERYIELA